MRITCEIDVVNRNLAACNIRKRRQAVRSQLSIGRRPGSQNKDGSLFLMVCSSVDKAGTKFLIKDNVGQVFTKFVSEGKATIRLREPPQDICISKVDIIQLKSFLSVLKKALEGQPISDITLSSLAPASNKAFDKPKTNIVISNRKDYPVFTNFPSTCEQLQVSNCGMKKIDGRILRLKSLTSLNLSNNTLTSLPGDIGDLGKLSELILSENELTQLPASLFRSSLKDSLTLLDVSDNKISDLHPSIALLQMLVTLKLDRNELTTLPITIGKLQKLRHLSAARNQISVLPGGALKLRLETLDLFENVFPSSTTDDTPTPSGEVMPGVPSLMEVAARFVKKHSIPYDADLIFSHMCSYLDSARTCWCGDPCFLSSTRRVQRIDLHKIVSSSVTALDQRGTTHVPFDIFLCSAKCVTKFDKNPRAYWR